MKIQPTTPERNPLLLVRRTLHRHSFTWAVYHAQRVIYAAACPPCGFWFNIPEPGGGYASIEIRPLEIPFQDYFAKGIESNTLEIKYGYDYRTQTLIIVDAVTVKTTRYLDELEKLWSNQ